MVELRKITKDNYEECLKLSVADNQKNFVSLTVHAFAFCETGEVAGNEVEMKYTVKEASGV